MRKLWFVGWVVAEYVRLRGEDRMAGTAPDNAESYTKVERARSRRERRCAKAAKLRLRVSSRVAADKTACEEGPTECGAQPAAEASSCVVTGRENWAPTACGESVTNLRWAGGLTLAIDVIFQPPLEIFDTVPRAYPGLFFRRVLTK